MSDMPMSMQNPHANLPLFATATARASDPLTSHQAAAAVTAEIRTAVEATLEALAVFGPCDDETLQRRYDEIARLPAREAQGYRWPRQRCVRKRRKDLVDLSLVRDSGRRTRNPVGLSVIVWELTEVGHLAAASLRTDG